MTDSLHIPEQWLSLLIGEVADVVAGGTPKASDPENFAESGTQIPWLTPADLSKYSEKYISHGARDLSKAGYESSSAKLMPTGALLFSSRAPIGYVAVAANKISTNQGFKNFVLPAEIDSSYSYYFLRSIRDVAESMGTGTTFKEISGANAKKLPFILPPLAEQKVIADKLDTLLAQLENTKARLERLPKILKRFRQSVLAAAVSGRLTDEWRERHSYERKKPTEGKEKYKAELFDSARESLPSIPSTWIVIPAASVLEYVTSGSRGWSQYYSDTGALFLRMSNLRYDTTRLDLKDLQYVLLPEDVEGKRSLVKKNDLVVSITADVGRVALLNNDLEEAYVNQHLALLRPSSDINSEYFASCIAALNVGMKQVSTFKRGATKAGLGLDDIRSLAIPFPSIEEQTEIVRRVDQLFAHADRIEQLFNNAMSRVNNLTQSILAKAFRGELTEQWRKDNPGLISGENSAEALLERIRAEREQQTNQKKYKSTVA